MSRTVDDVRKQLAATHLDYPHSRAVHDVELLLAEIDRLREGLKAIAACTPVTTPRPLPPTTDEQWHSLNTEARSVAHDNFEHGLALARWELSRQAYDALTE